MAMNEVEKDVHDRRNTSWLIPGLIILALVIIVPLAMRNRNNPEVKGLSTIGQQNSDTNTINDILDNPDNYVGKQITLSGKIHEVLDNNSLTLKASGINRDLLVITSNSLFTNIQNDNSALYKDDDNVQISGMVQKFDKTTIENQLGLVLNDNKLNDYITKPVIVAQTITKLGSD